MDRNMKKHNYLPPITTIIKSCASRIIATSNDISDNDIPLTGDKTDEFDAKQRTGHFYEEYFE